jgi:tetrahydromethanopterin S-methyltransferase subunit F
MSKILFGFICGLVFGIIDVIVMIPLKFEDKRKRIEAMSSAFIERFMLGFIIPNIDIGLNPAIAGGLLGIGLSLPASIITRAYIPINAIGLVGGIAIGVITSIVY